MEFEAVTFPQQRSTTKNPRAKKPKNPKLKKPDDDELLDWIKRVKATHAEYGWKRVLRDLRLERGEQYDVSEWRVKRLMRQCDLMVKGEHSMWCQKSGKSSRAGSTSSGGGHENQLDFRMQHSVPLAPGLAHPPGHARSSSGTELFVRASGGLYSREATDQFVERVFRGNPHGQALTFDLLVRLVTFVNKLETVMNTDDLNWFLHFPLPLQIRVIACLGFAAEACARYPSPDIEARNDYAIRLQQVYMLLNSCFSMAYAQQQQQMQHNYVLGHTLPSPTTTAHAGQSSTLFDTLAPTSSMAVGDLSWNQLLLAE